jgi:hypothetical protein
MKSVLQKKKSLKGRATTIYLRTRHANGFKILVTDLDKCMCRQLWVGKKDRRAVIQTNITTLPDTFDVNLVLHRREIRTTSSKRRIFSYVYKERRKFASLSVWLAESIAEFVLPLNLLPLEPHLRSASWKVLHLSIQQLTGDGS